MGHAHFLNSELFCLFLFSNQTWLLDLTITLNCSIIEYIMTALFTPCYISIPCCNNPQKPILSPDLFDDVRNVLRLSEIVK